jgi:tetratricopeptide (TPR) repeat protein
MTPQLWPTIEKALRDSRYFILMADPQSAESEWVQKEVACWLGMGRAENMLIVWTGGELVWDRVKKDFDWDRTNSLLPILAGVFKGNEPLYEDLRWARTASDLSRKHLKFTRAVARLSAAIRGRTLDDIFGEDIELQRRSQRFLWGGITILSVLLLTSVVLGIVASNVANQERIARGEAEKQTKAANQARDRGDGLINFMLIDLRDKLQPIGRLNVLDDVAKKAKEYLDTLPKELVTSPRLRQQGLMLDNLGDVLVAQGKLPEALEAYQQTLAISKRLADQDKSNADGQRDLSFGYERVGGVLAAQGKLPEALEAYQQSLTIRRTLADQDKSNAGGQRDLAVSYEKVGGVLALQGKLPEALEVFQQCLTIAKRLADQDKSNAVGQRDLAVSYEKVGDVLALQGKLPEALELYQQSLTIIKRLADQDKSNAGWQRDLIVSLCRVAIVRTEIGGNDNVAQAQEFLRTAMTLTERYPGPDRQNLLDFLNLTLQDLVKSAGGTGRALIAP